MPVAYGGKAVIRAGSSVSSASTANFAGGTSTPQIRSLRFKKTLFHQSDRIAITINNQQLTIPNYYE
ncbi:MAG: hypothetical protein KME46_05670 [Brasilonema angustatum HA4187-MV1]|jgi:hypothetical protein|nr:hypothetical protein [Brasilonema angustatum HA4187-MV1]